MVRGNSSVLPSLLHLFIIVASCVTPLSSLIVPIRPHTGMPAQGKVVQGSRSPLFTLSHLVCSTRILIQSSWHRSARHSHPPSALRLPLANCISFSRTKRKTGCGNTFVVHCIMSIDQIWIIYISSDSWYSGLLGKV